MTIPGRAHVVSMGQGRTVDLGVAQMRVLASGEATNGGAFALTEFSGTAEGAWTVPHLHRGFEESFFILDGLFTFTIGEEAIAASPGMYLLVPRGTPPHAQRSPRRRPVPALDGARRAREDVLRARPAAAKRDPRPGRARGHLCPLRLDPGVAMTPHSATAFVGRPDPQLGSPDCRSASLRRSRPSSRRPLETTALRASEGGRRPYASACPGREELPERGSERHHGNSADR